jgi:hypothetical protein
LVLAPIASADGTSARPVRVWLVQGGYADELCSSVIAVGAYVVRRRVLHVRGPDISARPALRVLPPQAVVRIGTELAALGPGQGGWYGRDGFDGTMHGDGLVQIPDEDGGVADCTIGGIRIIPLDIGPWS